MPILPQRGRTHFNRVYRSALRLAGDPASTLDSSRSASLPYAKPPLVGAQNLVLDLPTCELAAGRRNHAVRPGDLPSRQDLASLATEVLRDQAPPFRSDSRSARYSIGTSMLSRPRPVTGETEPLPRAFSLAGLRCVVSESPKVLPNRKAEPWFRRSCTHNSGVKLRAVLARRWLCQRRDKADPSASTVC
jgi:hypothetical protein